MTRTEKTAQKARQAKRQPRGGARAARVASEVAANAGPRPRGGARPGAGRPRREPDEVSKRRFRDNYLRDVVTLHLSRVRFDGKAIDAALADLRRECPQYSWPAALNDREREALEKREKFSADRGAGIRKIAAWFVARALGKSETWVREFLPGKLMQPVRAKPVKLPPVTEADPMGYFCEHYLPATDPERTEELRRFVRTWNRAMDRPEVAGHRRQAGHALVRYCERACGRVLSPEQKHACSGACRKIVRSLAHRR